MIDNYKSRHYKILLFNKNMKLNMVKLSLFLHCETGTF